MKNLRAADSMHAAFEKVPGRTRELLFALDNEDKRVLPSLAGHGFPTVRAIELHGKFHGKQ